MIESCPAEHHLFLPPDVPDDVDGPVDWDGRPEDLNCRQCGATWAEAQE